MDDTAKRQRLQVLHEAVKTCQRCSLAASRTKAVFGEGAYSAPVMIIGEAPGRDEDKAGRPFIGRAGHVLDRLLSESGMGRGKVWITNAVACWPPPGTAHRWQGKPTLEQVAICRAHVKAQIELVQPEVVVCMGAIAAGAMFPDLRFDHIRLGELLEKQERGLLRSPLHDDVRVAYHPAYLTRSGQSETSPLIKAALVNVHILRAAWATASARRSART